MDNTRQLLDDTVLNCMFQDRYMTLDLCVRLEPISALFSAKVDQFYRQLKQIDVKDFLSRESNVNWARKIFHRCPNIKTVDNVQVVKKSLKLDAICFQLLSMMKSVSNLGVKFEHFYPFLMLPMVGMASLGHLNISRRCVSSVNPLRNLVPGEKLRVTSLHCDELQLIDICHLDHLEACRLEFPSVDINELIAKLLDLRNLRELTARLYCPKNIDRLRRLVNFVLDVLRVDSFYIELYDWLDETRFSEICLNSSVLKKSITELSLADISAGCVPSILEFSQLRSLCLDDVKFSLDIFLKTLPNLCCLEAEYSSHVESAEGGAVLRFKSTFNKRYYT